MIGSEHRAHLAQAFSNLLGQATEGAVAYVTCLAGDQVDALIDADDFVVPGWTVSAVVNTSGHRRLTADQAVEHRENKAGAALLLIDRIRAGAGLDGIYSAGREIREGELFSEAQRLARRRLRGGARFLDNAVKRAERMGRRRKITPWGVFDFYVAAAAESEGRALARLGLWPIRRVGAPDDGELDLSAALANRLLYAGDTQSIGERVRSLLLNDPAQAAALERTLRTVAGSSPEAAALAIVERDELWLGPLVPGFASQSLREIRLVSWRDTRGGLLKWSGLLASAEGGLIPRLMLDPNAPAKDRGRLTVRWTAGPEGLAAGAVDYRVVVLSGEDELAELTIRHVDKPLQQIAFSVEDFEELEGHEKFEAVVRISVPGAEDVASQTSEAFTLEFGQVPGQLSSASGQIVRTLSEGAISLPSRAEFERAISNGSTTGTIEDKKGYITWKGIAGGRGFRIVRPALIKRIETDWVARGGPVGRWIQTVRTDGSPAGELAFEPAAVSPEDRVVDACRRLAAEIGPTGFLGRVLAIRSPASDAYANAWEKALDAGAPSLALHGTVEVRSQSGRILGLLVTPLHPLRFAWHSLYDTALAQARYEGGLSAQATTKAAAAIDGGHLPFVLPAPAGGERGFIFADVLGFHAVAMTVDGEPEPKSAVAILSSCLGGGGRVTAASVGDASATAIAREVSYYLACQTRPDGRRPDMINIQAWRPGDGSIVARALGQALTNSMKVNDEDEESPLCFTLDIYHPEGSNNSGSFLTSMGRRRRAGGQVLDAGDRWMTETAARVGEVMVPRLRWAKRPEPLHDGDWSGVRATHLGLAFDLFDARLETRPANALGETRPLHAYGLVRALERTVQLGEEPVWMTWGAPELTGETAPDNRTVGDRLRRLDRAVSRCVARSLGGSSDDWPVLVTRLPIEHRRRLDRLHERSDWVVTVDRNAGLEYFDAPHDRPDVFDRFIIDAVPERADLAALQLVTSTTNLDAVRDLVDEALADMGLSGSERNSRFLVNQLKALSGRLAIRLANGGTRTAELVALALVQANCAHATSGEDPWLELHNGVLVPVDEIADFAPIVTAGAEEEIARRADFIHVSAPIRGPLEFRFVEVKYRLHLRTARQPELLAHIAAQTSDLRRRWMDWFFGERQAPLERAVRRSQLTRLLRFYVERAARHRLTEVGRRRLLGEIDQLLLKEDYQPGAIEEPDVGYIFCPEHRAGAPEALDAETAGPIRFWLFGPTLLPDYASRFDLPPADTANANVVVKITEQDEPVANGAGETNMVLAPDTPAASELLAPGSDVNVLLGETPSGAPVEWRVSIRANPHLMLVGLPGMGKTTALINICQQLTGLGVAPVIFSYHDDIDEKLTASLGPLQTVDLDGLGFNPLRVDALGPSAHVDVAGTLRDIFASIFPELGDLQLEELRQAIKQSYDDLGWSTRAAGVTPPTPPFRAFFDILKSKPKPNANLIARLQELADYRFFDGAESGGGLLDGDRPTLVRVHGTTNGMLQNAFAAFVLYSLYKDMFRRGVQNRITHAVVFDEAHRAAKLKLIPRFAKECRKYGIALALASQGVRDFDSALFEAVGSYLVLRVTEADARTLARNTGQTADQIRTADRLKALEPYHALLFGASSIRPTFVNLVG
jgi:hypothetical protein